MANDLDIVTIVNDDGDERTIRRRAFDDTYKGLGWKIKRGKSSAAPSPAPVGENLDNEETPES